MMKQNYEEPMMEMQMLESEDVIVKSNGDKDDWEVGGLS